MITTPQGVQGAQPECENGNCTAINSSTTAKITIKYPSTTSPKYLRTAAPTYHSQAAERSTKASPSHDVDSAVEGFLGENVKFLIGILSIAVVAVMVIIQECKTMREIDERYDASRTTPVLRPDITPNPNHLPATTRAGQRYETGNSVTSKGEPTQPSGLSDINSIAITASAVFLGMIIIMVAIGAWCRWSQSRKEKEIKSRRDSTTPLEESDELDVASGIITPAVSEARTSNYSIPRPLNQSTQRSEQSSNSNYSMPGPPSGPFNNGEDVATWNNSQLSSAASPIVHPRVECLEQNGAASRRHSQETVLYHHLEQTRPRSETGLFLTIGSQAQSSSISSYNGNGIGNQQPKKNSLFYISPGTYVYKATEV